MALEIARDVAAGLAALRAKGVIHGDQKDRRQSSRKSRGLAAGEPALNGVPPAAGKTDHEFSMSYMRQARILSSRLDRIAIRAFQALSILFERDQTKLRPVQLNREVAK